MVQNIAFVLSCQHCQIKSAIKHAVSLWKHVCETTIVLQQTHTSARVRVHTHTIDMACFHYKHGGCRVSTMLHGWLCYCGLVQDKGSETAELRNDYWWEKPILLRF